MAFIRSLHSARIATFLLLTALLIWVEVTILHTSAFSRHPAGLSLAILFDLVFVTLGLFYWLIARPLKLARNRLVVVALLMLRIALAILPETAFLPNQLWPLLLVLVEGVVLIMAGLRIRTMTRTYRHLRLTADTETALYGSLTPVVGERGAGFIIGEGLTLYYTLLGWRLHSDIPAGAQPVTTHRQSGQIALQIGLLLVGIIEGVGVHLLISRWSPTAAFWITALSAYGMLFFLADSLATVKRPSYLTNSHLYLRLGLRWRATIPRACIANVLLISEKPAKQVGQFNGSFLTAPNTLLTFSEPICFTGPYGIRKEVNQFSFFVDDREAVRQVLTQTKPA